MSETTQSYIANILDSGRDRAAQWMKANTANTKVTRRAYLDVDRHLRAFADGSQPKSWVVMPGLRGTGKTTLLTQIYHDPKLSKMKKFFVSLDQVTLVGGTMVDLIAGIESSLSKKLEEAGEPIVLLLDEVQYMPDWGLAIKTIYDRTSRILIICTGSSALLLQRNPDVSRRVDIIKIHPLCFTEFIMMRQAQAQRSAPVRSSIKFPVKELSEKLRLALFDAADAQQAHDGLAGLASEVNSYWSGLDKNEAIGVYLKYGTLPFTLTIPEETIIWARVAQLMSDVLVRDVTALNEFEASTIASFPRILFILAASNETSMNSLSNALGINIRTIKTILDALEKTEIITGIPPKGSATVKVRKASKYLFTSPAMRAALCLGGASITPESKSTLMGSLLEDLVGLQLKRMFMAGSSRAHVEYDFAKGGANFIVQKGDLKSDSIAIEVGINKKTAQQAEATKKRLGSKYGLVITTTKLMIDVPKSVVYAPLEYFLLI